MSKYLIINLIFYPIIFNFQKVVFKTLIGGFMILSESKHSDSILKKSISDLSIKILDAIFENSSSAIELYDEKGILLDINQASLDIFGIAHKSEIESFNFFDDPNITPERNDDLLNGELVKYEAIINFDEIRRKSIFKTCKTGCINLKVTVIPIFDNDKNITRILFIGDQTALKLPEENI
jgi:PAS domain S-box-containing protein